MSNPIRSNQANLVFKSALNNPQLGQRLNVNCSEAKYIAGNGQKLDVIA